VRALNEVAAARGQSLAQMALRWVLRHETMTTALIGASRPEQIEENVASLQAPAFSADELSRIESILAT
jgi:L-glyceraldehyde 3-phosphate reductase